jgi:hypothetical protein
MTDILAQARELVARLRAACIGHPDAKIAWPHRLLHDAADTIEALALAEPKWGEIAEAPKDGTTVLITNGGWVSTGWFSHSIWLGQGSKEGGWVTDDERDSGIIQDDVTHWLPLPLPPKEEQ